jgi:hypothetical protein
MGKETCHGTHFSILAEGKAGGEICRELEGENTTLVRQPRIDTLALTDIKYTNDAIGGSRYK